MDLTRYKGMKARGRTRLEKVAATGGTIYRVFMTLNDPESGDVAERQIATVDPSEVTAMVQEATRIRQSYTELQTDIAALEAQP